MFRLVDTPHFVDQHRRVPGPFTGTTACIYGLAGQKLQYTSLSSSQQSLPVSYFGEASLAGVYQAMSRGVSVGIDPKLLGSQDQAVVHDDDKASCSFSRMVPNLSLTMRVDI